MSPFERQIFDLVRAAVRAEFEERANVENEPELERLPAAAKRFGVSVSFLKRLVLDGELEAFGRGRMRRVKPVQIRQLMKKSAEPSEPAPAASDPEVQRILASLPGGRRW